MLFYKIYFILHTAQHGKRHQSELFHFLVGNTYFPIPYKHVIPKFAVTKSAIIHAKLTWNTCRTVRSPPRLSSVWLQLRWLPVWSPRPLPPDLHLRHYQGQTGVGVQAQNLHCLQKQGVCLKFISNTDLYAQQNINLLKSSELISSKCSSATHARTWIAKANLQISISAIIVSFNLDIQDKCEFLLIKRIHSILFSPLMKDFNT